MPSCARQAIDRSAPVRLEASAWQGQIVLLQQAKKGSWTIVSVQAYRPRPVLSTC